MDFVRQVAFAQTLRSASVHVVLCGVGVGETVDANVVFRMWTIYLLSS